MPSHTAPTKCANPECSEMVTGIRIYCCGPCGKRAWHLKHASCAEERRSRRAANARAHEYRAAMAELAYRPATAIECKRRNPTPQSRVGNCTELLATSCFDARLHGQCRYCLGVA